MILSGPSKTCESIGDNNQTLLDLLDELLPDVLGELGYFCDLLAHGDGGDDGDCGGDGHGHGHGDGGCDLGELGDALDLAAHHRLQPRPDVGEHVPALRLVDKVRYVLKMYICFVPEISPC